jgi:hypothetical protein
MPKAPSQRQRSAASIKSTLTPSLMPAMAAGVTDKLWEIGSIVKVLED